MVGRLLLYQFAVKAHFLMACMVGILSACANASTPEDDCEILGENSCSEGCAGVYSGATSIREPCAVEGAFMGCAPAPDSRFWTERRRSEHSAQFAHCDLLRGRAPYFYCFEGEIALYWFWKNVDLFCNGQCVVEPITECD